MKILQIFPGKRIVFFYNPDYSICVTGVFYGMVLSYFL